VRLDDDDPDMVKGIVFYLYTSKYPGSINGQANHNQQGEIQEDEHYHCDTLEGKVFGTKKWWLRHVLMYKIADKWHHLLNELHQVSRRDEKGLGEGATKKAAEMPRSMIEEHDKLKIMLGAKPSYARNVIHYLRNQLQVKQGKREGTMVARLQYHNQSKEWLTSECGKDIGGSHHSTPNDVFRQQAL
jgi:hypothetical protein